jgi:hypothetical protein
MKFTSVKLNTHGVINSLCHTNSRCPRKSISTQPAIVCFVAGPHRIFINCHICGLLKIYLFIHLLVYSFLYLSCNDAVTIASTAQRRMVGWSVINWNQERKRVIRRLELCLFMPSTRIIDIDH